MGSSTRTGGTSNRTSPPPSGIAPRISTCSAAPSMPKWRSSGKLTVRSTSTLTSSGPFVMPLILMLSCFFANGASISSGCTKYPMAREVPQSCMMPSPPIIRPGLYFIAVPVSPMTISQPLTTFSRSRRKFAS